jgi:hypothetical protein
MYLPTAEDQLAGGVTAACAAAVAALLSQLPNSGITPI